MKLRKLGVGILILAVAGITAYTRFPFTTSARAGGCNLDSDMPSFENHYATDHFILKWTNKSSDPKDNISDPQIIKETAGYLETAWAKYTGLF